ncbi:MAG: hypothetical protein EZS28_002086 [Streblomastix strix]|uniref:Uncharacterized protein n=1 Tax=Streblomastix strix TaxID=222440 RepID=A0A5J4X6V8_9EUKA|nr:MAG: hypothetical protein EZS28_002086 [Streblomastix strix]
MTQPLKVIEDTSSFETIRQKRPRENAEDPTPIKRPRLGDMPQILGFLTSNTNQHDTPSPEQYPNPPVSATAKPKAQSDKIN